MVAKSILILNSCDTNYVLICTIFIQSQSSRYFRKKSMSKKWTFGKDDIDELIFLLSEMGCEDSSSEDCVEAESSDGHVRCSLVVDKH